jgi:hypothetical protein
MLTKCTDLEGEAAEYSAVVAAGDPEEERVIVAAGLRLDEVVEKLSAVVLVYLDVPYNSAAASYIQFESIKEGFAPPIYCSGAC